MLSNDSVVFNVSEILRIWNSLTESLSIFYVTVEGAYSRIKNVRQGIFSQEHKTHNSHAFCVLVFRP